MSLELKKTPKSNMMQIDTLYSITINPDDCHQYYGFPDRMDKLHKYWSKYFEKFSWRYNLYAEFSNPSNSKSFPRYHFHGLILFKSYKQLQRWYTRIQFELAKVAYFDFDTYDHTEHWKIYCRKSQDVMPLICEHDTHYTSLHPCGFHSKHPPNNEQSITKKLS